MTTDQSQADGDDVVFVDDVSDVAVGDAFKGTVTKQTTPGDGEGFAVNVLPSRSPPDFVEQVTGHFADRYDPGRFDDREPVGVVFVDRDDPSTVFPIGMWDTVAVVRPDDDERKEGGVAIVGRDGDELRLRGVGAVDVKPEYVVEVTERYDPDDV